MTKRIFRSVCVVSLAVLLVAMVLIIGALYSYFTAAQQNQLKIQVTLAAQAIAHEGVSYFDGLNTEDYRVTWIAADGTVLADSRAEATDMDNHLDREEIAEALEWGYGESVRYSDTLTERQVYTATRLEDGSVVRISGTQLSLFTLVIGLLPQIALTVAIALILALLLAIYEARRLVKPLNELNLDDPAANSDHTYEELKPLLHRIATQQNQLRGHADALRRQEIEFRAITDGLTDGLILFNEQGIVFSINRAATRLLEETADGNACDPASDPAEPSESTAGSRKHIRAEGWQVSELPPALGLESLLNGARAAGVSETTARVCNISYRLHADPIVSDGRTVGFVVHIINIAEQEQNEQMRREFTANVSHELKTPIHTIAGCSELLAEGMVAPEDVPAFARQIHAEAGRMIRLVEDIIRLSHLDEGAEDMQKTDLDLYAVAEAAVGSLTTEATAAEVTLTLTGERGAMVYGIPQLLSGVVVNLCDNAIKYNRRGGSVTVDVAREDRPEGDTVRLTVADTGIGIPAEHHSRIFERFYRVDKSHSKEVGGTGLGLSIVKHTVRLHGGSIDLKSRVGEGTVITVRLPAHKESS